MNEPVVESQAAGSRNRTRAIVAALVILVVLTPWWLGLAVNITRGGDEFVYFWGRKYNRSAVDPEWGTAPGDLTISLVGFVAGSTVLPNPFWTLGETGSPTVLYLELPDGHYRAYELSGGP